MMPAYLHRRQKNTCSQPYLWYSCAKGPFKGCCSIDPCNTGICPKDKYGGDGNGGGSDEISEPTTTSTSITTDHHSSSSVQASSTSKPAPLPVTTSASLSPSSTLSSHGDFKLSSTTAVTTTATTVPSTPASGPDGGIIGGVVGGTVVGLFVAGLLFFFWRRRRKSGNEFIFSSSGNGPPNAAGPNKGATHGPTPSSDKLGYVEYQGNNGKDSRFGSGNHFSTYSKSSASSETPTLVGSPVESKDRSTYSNSSSPAISAGSSAYSSPSLSQGHTRSGVTSLATLDEDPRYAQERSHLLAKTELLASVPTRAGLTPELQDTGFNRSHVELATEAQRELINVPQAQRSSNSTTATTTSSQNGLRNARFELSSEPRRELINIPPGLRPNAPLARNSQTSTESRLQFTTTDGVILRPNLNQAKDPTEPPADDEHVMSFMTYRPGYYPSPETTPRNSDPV